MMRTRANHNPDAVLLHIGSNDMNGGDSIAETVQEIEDIVAAILSSNNNAVVFVANIIPWHSDANNQWNADIEGSVQALGTELESAILGMGNENVVLVDVRTGFLEIYMQSDLIHPNETGEAYLASKWYDALVEKNLCITEPDHSNDPTVEVRLLQSVATDLCISIPDASVLPGANADSAVCDTQATHQQLRFINAPGTTNSYSMQFVHSNLCLTIPANSSANGASLTQTACNDSAEQQFDIDQLNGVMAIFTGNGNKVIDSHAITDDIIQWQDYGNDNQRWVALSPTASQ